MNWISVPVAGMAAICLYVSLYYYWMYDRRRVQKENLLFSLTCFTIALYDIFCVGLYNAGSVAVGLQWQRLQFASLALFCIVFMWFAYMVMRIPYKRLFQVISGWFSILFIGGIAIHNKFTLSPENPLPKNVNFAGIVVTYNEADPGLLYLVQYVSMALGFAFLLYLIIRQYRASRRMRSLFFLIAMCSFFVAAVNDILVGAAVYQFIYVVEYAYMLIILSMANWLLQDFVDLHNEVSDLNINLEKKVSQRTEELHAAMEEMEAINDRLTQTNTDLEEAQRIASLDMQMAYNIQSRMFPAEAPKVDGWDIAFIFRPAHGISGDLYDFYAGEGKLDGVVLFDVSGHGLSSGLLTLVVKSIMLRNFNQMRDCRLNEVMERINADVVQEIRDVDNYLTGIMLRFDVDIVEYVNAGHLDPLIRRKGKTMLLKPAGSDSGGPPIGIAGYTGKYNNVKFSVMRDDVIMFYTDGLSEAKNANGEEYGGERVLEALRRAPKSTAQVMLEFILDDVQSFTGISLQADDMTAIILRRTV